MILYNFLIAVNRRGFAVRGNHVLKPILQPLAERKLPGDHGLAFVPFGFVAAQRGAGFCKLGKSFGLLSLSSRLRIDSEIQIDIVFLALVVVGDIAFYLFPRHAFHLPPAVFRLNIEHSSKNIYQKLSKSIYGVENCKSTAISCDIAVLF